MEGGTPRCRAHNVIDHNARVLCDSAVIGALIRCLMRSNLWSNYGLLLDYCDCCLASLSAGLKAMENPCAYYSYSYAPGNYMVGGVSSYWAGGSGNHKQCGKIARDAIITLANSIEASAQGLLLHSFLPEYTGQ
jgi:hypothetical protein